jgi:hypothetical protein
MSCLFYSGHGRFAHKTVVKPLSTLLLVLLVALGAARFVYALTASAPGWSGNAYMEIVYEHQNRSLDRPGGEGLKRRWGPLFLLIMAGFTRLFSQPHALRIALRWCLVSAYLLTIYLLCRLFVDFKWPWPERERVCRSLLLVLLCFQSTSAIYAISNGSETISALCVIGHFYCFVRKRYLAAALLICFGVYFKLHSIVFAFPYVVFSGLSPAHRKYSLSMILVGLITASVSLPVAGWKLGFFYPFSMMYWVTTDSELVPLLSKEVFGPAFFIGRIMTSFKVLAVDPRAAAATTTIATVMTALLICSTLAAAIVLRKYEGVWNDESRRAVGLLVFQSVIGFLMFSFSLDLSMTLLLPFMISFYAPLWLFSQPICGSGKPTPLMIGTFALFAVGLALIGNLIPLSLLFRVLPLEGLDQLAGNSPAELIPIEKYIWYQIPMIGVYVIALAFGGSVLSLRRANETGRRDCANAPPCSPRPTPPHGPALPDTGRRSS